MPNYDDIIHTKAPIPLRHGRMPVEDRAAQFAPFAALTGYEAAVEEAGRQTERKVELDENEKALEEGPLDEEDGSSDEELPEDELDADEDADANDEPAADEDANADDEPEDADLNEEELEDLEDALDMEIEPI